MRKKYLILFCLAALALLGAVREIAPQKAYADAKSEIAMELSTRTVLSESNADAVLPMASTTKIMTALIIAEDCDLDEIITVPDGAVGAEGSSIYLKKGEQIDIRDLLYGLMLRSGNDAAAALAIHHSGSIEGFAEVMNARAKQIGAKNTNFKNPSGLPDEEHYTTARDLCTIACHAMNNRIFNEVVSSKSHTGKFRAFQNKNKMLTSYDGANGVKTGYTVKAGRCLVSSAERNGMDVVTVVLDCRDMYERSKKLLDYCFDGYELLKIDENKVFTSDRVLCKLQNADNIVLKKGQTLNFKVVPVECSRKFKVGDLCAKLEIYTSNGLLFDGNLYSIIDEK